VYATLIVYRQISFDWNIDKHNISFFLMPLLALVVNIIICSFLSIRFNANIRKILRNKIIFSVVCIFVMFALHEEKPEFLSDYSHFVDFLFNYAFYCFYYIPLMILPFKKLSYVQLPKKIMVYCPIITMLFLCISHIVMPLFMIYQAEKTANNRPYCVMRLKDYGSHYYIKTIEIADNNRTKIKIKAYMDKSEYTPIKNFYDLNMLINHQIIITLSSQLNSQEMSNFYVWGGAGRYNFPKMKDYQGGEPLLKKDFNFLPFSDFFYKYDYSESPKQSCNLEKNYLINHLF
jgi:FlaA1/EpsC-like NDP-sugar epimerase